jgi:hypothetical protein
MGVPAPSMNLDRPSPQSLTLGYPEDILSYTMVKVLVTLPEELLVRVDRAAGEEGVSRSEFLAEAAGRALGWPTRSRLDALVASARQALSSAGAFESADMIATDRAARDAADRRR